MKKILVSTLLVLILIVNNFSYAFAETNYTVGENIVEKLSSMTSQERNSALLMLQPILGSDSGINLAKVMIDQYSPSSGASSDIIGNILANTDKQTLINYLDFVKTIDPSIREKYLKSFNDKNTFPLSLSAKESLNTLLSLQFRNKNKLDSMLDEDGISYETLANFILIINAANYNSPVLSYKNGNFVFTLNNNLSENLTKYTSFSPANVEKKLNAFSDVTKKDILVIGTLLKFINQEDYIIANPSTSANNSAEKLPVIQNSENYGFTIKTDSIFSCDTSDCNIAIYNTDSPDKPEKLVYIYNNKIYALLSSGNYILVKKSSPFEDNNSWGKDYINRLFYNGIVSGIKSEQFAPERNITREEFVKLIVELFNISAENTSDLPFKDVNKNEWYYKYVSKAYHAKIINGISDNEFGTGNNISRQDMCLIIYNALSQYSPNFKLANAANLSFIDNNNISPYAINSIDYLYSNNVISGDDTNHFLPTNNATRQEACKIICGVISLLVK